ncbi:MAG: phenylalanine--tRNA ligase subunit beta [Syntrophales bacterium]|jgi:phenylalanyl-tRNA synthetase beta chain|nr:phenylalanine--tRNA ligase subunit beta [Syntrophales bacterium]MCK9528791.1 phenylalanine--tRNA ligase subunit beta [Syntrophales bacterium]MDX9922738.1 phenylalanine--tRNA ligase subunit beta [Syntrophales bacterium]
MLVSLKWLKDYVDCSLPLEELAEILTMAGLEVESVTTVAPDFSGVVVAEITAITPHPNADKLVLCDVATGDETLRVVCGAPNTRTGALVALAKVGAVIPGGYTIKDSKIRGEASRGMLCSEQELGISDDHSGIMILDETLTPGEDLRTALDLYDTVLDISVTPNRSDCLSILGIAREVAALTGAPLRYPDSTCTESGRPVQEDASVEIQNPELCPRYTARLIRNVTIGPSPSWLKSRIEAVGLRAINNVVDVTNFVMMELGQPLHAFDYAFLEEGRIVVRGAEENEAFVSLDEKTRILKGDTLMICDGVKPVAIAGIMGGMNSEVQAGTDTILLESAYFNPRSIRKTSRAFGMSTDAAFRFERGVDPEGVTRALDRAARLMAELSGGSIAPGVIDEYPLKIDSPSAVRLRTERVAKILGTAVDTSRITEILRGLAMEVSGEGEEEGVLLVTPPSFRGDLTREIDLIEEVARVNGYETIPATIPRLEPVPREERQREALERLINTTMVGMGYSEVIHFSFTTPDSSRVLGYPEDHESRRYVRIANPLTEDTSVMRTSLIYGLLECVGKNVNAGNENLALFETGTVFFSTGGGTLPQEKKRIAGLLTGDRRSGQWHATDTPWDFYDLKGSLETLFAALGITSTRFVADDTVPWLTPGTSAAVCRGEQRLGALGEVHPEVLKRMDLDRKVFVFDLDRDALAASVTLDRHFREIPRYPAVTRDVSFLVGRDVTAEQICDLSRDNDEELLESVHIFDVYSGPVIPPGMKSLALRFTYRSQTRTLADQEVSDAHRRIVEQVLDRSGAKVRGLD